jgi:hypothetical protein
VLARYLATAAGTATEHHRRRLAVSVALLLVYRNYTIPLHTLTPSTHASDAGAEVNAEDDEGRTALGLASEAGSEKCVERLNKAGARYGRGDHASKRCKAKGFLSKHRAPSLRHPRDFEWDR